MPLNLLQAIVNHIHSNLDRPLRVRNIASTFHISHSQLFRIFQAKYGRSPRQYIEAALPGWQGCPDNIQKTENRFSRVLCFYRITVSVQP